MLLPAVNALTAVVAVGWAAALSFAPKVKREDGIATAGLFGAVSLTLAAMIQLLNIICLRGVGPCAVPIHGYTCLTAIVLANIHLHKQNPTMTSSTSGALSKIATYPPFQH